MPTTSTPLTMFAPCYFTVVPMWPKRGPQSTFLCHRILSKILTSTYIQIFFLIKNPGVTSTPATTPSTKMVKYWTNKILPEGINFYQFCKQLSINYCELLPSNKNCTMLVMYQLICETSRIAKFLQHQQSINYKQIICT